MHPNLNLVHSKNDLEIIHNHNSLSYYFWIFQTHQWIIKRHILIQVAIIFHCFHFKFIANIKNMFIFFPSNFSAGQGITKPFLSDCNGTRTHNQLVRKRTLNHLAKLVLGSSPIAGFFLLLIWFFWLCF